MTDSRRTTLRGVEELKKAEVTFQEHVNRFESMIKEISECLGNHTNRDNDSLRGFAENAEPLVAESRNLISENGSPLQVIADALRRGDKDKGSKSPQ